MVLCGPAGSGKSTVLRMLAGLVPVTGGRPLIDGDEVGSRPDWSSLVSTVFQNYSLYPHMTVDQNITLPLTQRGDTKAEIAGEVAIVADVLDLKGVLGQNATALVGSPPSGPILHFRGLKAQRRVGADLEIL